MEIEKNKLNSELQVFDKSMNEQLMKQKKLEDSLSLKKSQAIEKTNSEVIAFKPDQNNCCYCSCGNNVFDDSFKEFDNFNKKASNITKKRTKLHSTANSPHQKQ